MIKTFSGGLLDSNTYVYSTDTGCAMIIDFGVMLEEVKQYVDLIVGDSGGDLLCTAV